MNILQSLRNALTSHNSRVHPAPPTRERDDKPTMPGARPSDRAPGTASKTLLQRLVERVVGNRTPGVVQPALQRPSSPSQASQSPRSGLESKDFRRIDAPDNLSASDVFDGVTVHAPAPGDRVSRTLPEHVKAAVMIWTSADGTSSLHTTNYRKAVDVMCPPGTARLLDGITALLEKVDKKTRPEPGAAQDDAGLVQKWWTDSSTHESISNLKPVLQNRLAEMASGRSAMNSSDVETLKHARDELFATTRAAYRVGVNSFSVESKAPPNPNPEIPDNNRKVAVPAARLEELGVKPNRYDKKPAQPASPSGSTTTDSKYGESRASPFAEHSVSTAERREVPPDDSIGFWSRQSSFPVLRAIFLEKAKASWVEGEVTALIGIDAIDKKIKANAPREEIFAAANAWFKKSKVDETLNISDPLENTLKTRLESETTTSPELQKVLGRVKGEILGMMQDPYRAALTAWHEAPTHEGV